MPPVATYRLQVHGGFSLDQARAIVPYLGALGVSHVHSSPLLAARPGSEHGYDVTDPTRVNPEVGGEAALAAFVAALAARGMGLVLDIVPNHMAASAENRPWEDVLANGPASPYASWFDIAWREGEGPAPGRVLLPVLGDMRVRVLERGELGLRYTDGRFRVTYFEHSWPTDPATTAALFERAANTIGSGAAAALRRLAADVRDLPRRVVRSAEDRARRAAAADAIAGRVRTLTAESPSGTDALERVATEWPTGPDGMKRMRRLLDAQPYRLVYWRRAEREINYRRFFDVNELVALHAEDPDVFAATHALPLGWLEQGRVHGFRIDHPDGLLDPLAYLRRLSRAAAERAPGGPAPLWVEKILAPGERLRAAWPASGTTGYDFLNDCERTFVDPDGFARVAADYHRIVRSSATFAAVARAAKRAVLESGLAAGVRQLAARIRRTAGAAGIAALPQRHSLEIALVETIAALPVYRTYVDPATPVPEGEDRALLSAAVQSARARGRAAAPAMDLVAGILMGDDPRLRTPGAEQQRLRVVQRFQQLSGPAAAKGIEDTAFYSYVPLLSLNEVGGGPERIGESSATVEFHAAAAARAERWPESLLALTTHDTKRSADVRARLAVLSEFPAEWEETFYRCRRLARPFGRTVRGRTAPDANTTWLFFQTLVGAWPARFAAPGAPLPDADCLGTLRERLSDYMLKAVREAKHRTSWTDPDVEFEEAVRDYVGAVVDPVRGAAVLREAARLVTTIGRPGLWAALARSVLHLTSPGIPDIYQGDELWNFTLVDPDNRRPVNFARRASMLSAMSGPSDPESLRAFVRELTAAPEDGRIKLHVARAALSARRTTPALCEAGTYAPLHAEGARARQLVGFHRSAGGSRAMVLVPRLVARETGPVGAPVGDFWKGTTVNGVPNGRWICAFTARSIDVSDGRAAVADLLWLFPAALLVAETT